MYKNFAEESDNNQNNSFSLNQETKILKDFYLNKFDLINLKKITKQKNVKDNNNNNRKNKRYESIIKIKIKETIIKPNLADVYYTKNTDINIFFINLKKASLNKTKSYSDEEKIKIIQTEIRSKLLTEFNIYIKYKSIKIIEEK